MYEVAQPYFSNQDISWIKKGVEKVLKGQLSTGPYVKEFEEKFAKQVGCKYAVFVTNATAALEISCKVLGLKEGDDVIVPGETFVATGTCVTLNGGNLVFAEVDPDTFCMTLDEIKRRVTKNTKGVIIVHFGGYVSPDTLLIRDYCKNNKLFLIEDAAHAFGTTYQGKRIGSFGDIACFSFDGIKNITSGEGGCIITDDETILQKVRDARLLGVEKDTNKRYAGERSWDFETTTQGWRYHMSNIMAAIGNEQLKRFNRVYTFRPLFSRPTTSRYGSSKWDQLGDWITCRFRAILLSKILLHYI